MINPTQVAWRLQVISYLFPRPFSGICSVQRAHACCHPAIGQRFPFCSSHIYKNLKPYSGLLCYFNISDHNFSTSFYSELNMMWNIKLVCDIIHPNDLVCWRNIMVNHRRPYTWKVICTHLTAVACPSLTQSVYLREPQRPAVFHILCQTYFVCKFLHDSICTVSRGIWVGGPTKFIFTLDPLKSPALLYANIASVVK